MPCSDKYAKSFPHISPMASWILRMLTALEHSFCKALELGYDLIVILGNPGNYVGLGFKSCKKYNICMEGGVYPSSLSPRTER